MLKSQTTSPFNLKRFFVGEGPQAIPMRLHHRRVYILPTRSGLIFAALLFCMLLASVNYHNNMGYLLTFLLGGVTITSIFYTYKNLLGLEIGPASGKPVFAKQEVRINIQVQNHSQQDRLAIECYLPGKPHEVVDIKAHHPNSMPLTLSFQRRGYQPLPRFVIETVYPFGLFRAWSHIELDQKILVYPMPASDKFLPMDSQGGEEGQQENKQGQEDFSGLQTYQPGDSLYHVHWKAAAKHHILQTKQYSGLTSQECYLNWEDSTHTDTEMRLSQLTAWVILADLAGVPYGLDIPGTHYSAATGRTHKQRCLTALALYGTGQYANT